MKTRNFWQWRSITVLVLFLFANTCYAVLRDLIEAARSASESDAIDKWNEVLSLHPTNGEAILQLGLLYVSRGVEFSVQGIRNFERILDKENVDRSSIELAPPQLFALSNFVGRYRWQEREYKPAKRYLEMALGYKPDDVCTQAMVATLLDIFPNSVAEADKSLRLYHERMDALIELSASSVPNEHHLHIDPLTVNLVPNMMEDQYYHCILTLFYHSFYYRGDVAAATMKYFQVVASVFPELLYTSPYVTRRRLAIPPQKGYLSGNETNISNKKLCVKRKLRLGVASGFMSENSSVSADFGGVLSKLDRNIFDITYIFLKDGRLGRNAKFIQDKRDKLIVITKDDKSQGPPETRHSWLQHAHIQVSKLDLDVLYYLDATMSGHAHRFAMSKLAPVQALSHGHPITSGIPREIMDYYISWAGAELEYDVAQHHYTEELKLLPADKMHQYYDNRIDDGKSIIDGMPFDKLVANGRAISFQEIPSDGNWYLCMQKPFKLHPEFDDLISGILNKDPMARILLHEESTESNKQIFIRRLQAAGMRMERVHFVPVQQHHRLLALYELSDVILDSYPSGGCTTTREVLEIGKPVVTWPAKLLGSRWSLAYYNILNDSELNKAVIASSAKEYIDLAVQLGTDKAVRKDVERRVQKNVHKIFRRKESVEEWTKMLLNIAPVQPVGNNGICVNEFSWSKEHVREGMMKDEL